MGIYHSGNKFLPEPLKLLATIFLSALILISVNRDAWVFLSFKMNQEYIAKNLCEKKDVVQNSCCGKCYLKKQITQNQKTDTNPTCSIPEKTLQPLVYELKTISKWKVFLAESTVKSDPANEVLPSGITLPGIFHPPKI